jgi:hypothetical protein
VIRGQNVGRKALAASRLNVETAQTLTALGFHLYGRSLRLVPLPVFKTVLGFARGLVGSIPIFSRQKYRCGS